MTYNEVVSIAKRLDKETKLRIDACVDERMDLLAGSELTKSEMTKMEECLYMSLVLQEYLEGENELLEEEKMLLLAEMEELFDEYGELLSNAKIEDKKAKKRLMAMDLKRIREELFIKKDAFKAIRAQVKENRKNMKDLKDATSEKNISLLAGLGLGEAGAAQEKGVKKSSGGGSSEGASKEYVKRKIKDLKKSMAGNVNKESKSTKEKGNKGAIVDPLKKTDVVKRVTDSVCAITNRPSMTFEALVHSEVVENHIARYRDARNNDKNL